MHHATTGPAHPHPATSRPYPSSPAPTYSSLVKSSLGTARSVQHFSTPVPLYPLPANQPPPAPRVLHKGDPPPGLQERVDLGTSYSHMTGQHSEPQHYAVVSSESQDIYPYLYLLSSYVADTQPRLVVAKKS